MNAGFNTTSYEKRGPYGNPTGLRRMRLRLGGGVVGWGARHGFIWRRSRLRLGQKLAASAPLKQVALPSGIWVLGELRELPSRCGELQARNINACYEEERSQGSS